MLSLWRSDGTLLVRSPTLPGATGRNFASGENYRRHVVPRDVRPFWSKGSTDGVERVIAFGFLFVLPLAYGANGVLLWWRRRRA